VPWVWGEPEKHKSPGALINELDRRFEEYKSKVVYRFYKKYFKNLDRQIVLVDCLTALKNGGAALDDLIETIAVLTENFSYGKLGRLKRVLGFAPKIDRLAFAATKADHILPEQQDELRNLLESIFKYKNAAKGESVETKYFSMAAVRAAEVVEDKNPDGSVWRGIKAGDKAVRPGSIPRRLTPSILEKFAAGFRLLALPPPRDWPVDEPLPQINVGKVLEFLVGDKLL
jgi:predicted YcjX-like family ATPase